MLEGSAHIRLILLGSKGLVVPLKYTFFYSMSEWALWSEIWIIMKMLFCWEIARSDQTDSSSPRKFEYEWAFAAAESSWCKFLPKVKLKPSAFCVKLNSPFLLFKDNKFWNTKITGVISEKINCSMCNCRLIACPLPSEARAIVYSLSHDERPSVVVQENLLFCNLHYRLQSHHDQKHVGGSKEVLCQAK